MHEYLNPKEILFNIIQFSVLLSAAFSLHLLSDTDLLSHCLSYPPKPQLWTLQAQFLNLVLIHVFFINLDLTGLKHTSNKLYIDKVLSHSPALLVITSIGWLSYPGEWSARKIWTLRGLQRSLKRTIMGWKMWKIEYWSGN